MSPITITKQKDENFELWFSLVDVNAFVITITPLHIYKDKTYMYIISDQIMECILCWSIIRKVSIF